MNIVKTLFFSFCSKIGDTIEIESMEKLFCTGRKGPMKIGSVKSNMGHGEACSALCSITKLVLTFESDQIPPNLHYKNPGTELTALHDGRIEVNAIYRIIDFISRALFFQGKFFFIRS